MDFNSFMMQHFSHNTRSQLAFIRGLAAMASTSVAENLPVLCRNIEELAWALQLRLQTFDLAIQLSQGQEISRKKQLLSSGFLFDWMREAARKERYKLREVVIEENPPKHYFKILGDPNLIEVALYNILRNGVGLGSSKSPIKIELRGNDDVIWCAVECHGPPLGSIIVEEISSPDPPQSPSIDLWVAAQVAKSLGGRVALSSSELTSKTSQIRVSLHLPAEWEPEFEKDGD